MGSTPPVLLVIFNRPDLTALALESIRQARPTRLFVAADGPRDSHPDDRDLCSAARAVIDTVDWPCDIVRDFSETNLGCGVRPSSAVTWALEHTDRIMVMEDDCIPSASCYNFCGELLDYYAAEERVMHIGCTNFRPRDPRARHSYRFSKYAHGVCWATWRRAWLHYDHDMLTWPDFRSSDAFRSQCASRLEMNYWTYYWDRAHSKLMKSTWDYQWTFACWVHNGFAISPSVNLVTNTGFRPDGTHTTAEAPWANMPTFEIGEIVHPAQVEADRRADWWEFVHHYGGEWYRQEMRFTNRLRRAVHPIRRLAREMLGR